MSFAGIVLSAHIVNHDANKVAILGASSLGQTSCMLDPFVSSTIAISFWNGPGCSTATRSLYFVDIHLTVESVEVIERTGWNLHNCCLVWHLVTSAD